MATKPNGMADETKKTGGGKPTKAKKKSSGRTKGRHIGQAIKAVKRKITQYEARQKAGFKIARELRKGIPARKRWDTSGLLAHLHDLEQEKKRVGDVFFRKAA